jgi:hypothetical protein
VVLKFTPSDYRVARIDLEPCTGNFDILDIEETKKIVTLRPNEQQVIYWKFDINEDLPTNYMYTCPMTLNSRSLALRSINLEVDPSLGVRTTRRLNANLKSGTIKLGQDQAVYVNPIISGLTKIGIVTEDDIRTWDITRNQELLHEFVPKSLGDQEVIVFSSEGEVLELPFSVKSDLLVQITSFDVPNYLKLNDVEEISAVITNTGISEKSLRVTLDVNGDEDLTNIALTKVHEITKDISFGTPGQKAVTMTVKNGDIDLTEKAYVNVFREPKLTYDVEYDSETGIGTLVLDVKNSDIRNVSVRMGDQEKGYAEMTGRSDVEFMIGKGKYDLTIEYRDLAGNPYIAKETIEFRDPDFFEMIFRALSGFLEAIMGIFGS